MLLVDLCTIQRTLHQLEIMSDNRFTYQHMSDLALKALLHRGNDEAFQALVDDIPEPGGCLLPADLLNGILTHTFKHCRHRHPSWPGPASAR